MYFFFFFSRLQRSSGSMTIFCAWCYAVLSALLLFRAGNVDGIQARLMKFGRAPLLERFAWQKLDFSYPDERSRQLAIASGEYVPENALPVGIEIWRNKLFVTIPRWRNGEDITELHQLFGWHWSVSVPGKSLFYLPQYRRAFRIAEREWGQNWNIQNNRHNMTLWFFLEIRQSDGFP